MKKDYISVKAEQTDLAEIDLVEQYWTAIWQREGAKWQTRVDSVARREEYHLMVPYLRQIEPGGRILDAGCGLGEWTMFLTNQGYDVYGVDISQQTIALLTSHFPNYRFSRADIRQLDFPDDFFSAYFSWGVFEHFEEGLGSCIAEAWRVLQPGGLLIISVPFHNWRHIFRDTRPLYRWDGNHYDPNQGYSEPMRFYQWRLTVPELEQELAMQGFQVLQIRPIALRHGLQRTLHLDFCLKPRQGRSINSIASRVLSWIAPRRWFCHMLLAVAKKSH